jgi:hypothetical protein
VSRLAASKTATAQSFFSDLMSKVDVVLVPYEEKTTTKGEGSFGVDIKLAKASAGGGISRDRTSRFLGTDPFSPNQLLAFFAKVGGEHIVIVDEFDELIQTSESNDITKRLMEFAKLAADDRDGKFRVRFIFAGLTHKSAELLKRHDSINRYIDGIALKRINRAECSRFFENGERLSGFTFHPVVRDTIINDSNGYPYFLQEVANHCCRAADEEGRREINLPHYKKGLEGARVAVERAQNVRFYENYGRLSEIARCVLDAVALTKQVEVRISKLVSDLTQNGKGWKPEAITIALEQLVRSDIFLYRAVDRDVVGFVEPFFQGYLERRLEGPIKSKLTSMSSDQFLLDLPNNLRGSRPRRPR